MTENAPSDARWQRLQVLFAAAIERPAAERETWLREAEPDADLRREALALAAADDDARARVTGHFGAAVQGAIEAPGENRRLGPYRLLREIGVGGMGAVFLAQRADDEFENRVAIKLIRGVATRAAGERLRHERQILANLNHPHIARLLDGGTTDSGQPYLVMDFVEGVDIVQYCRRREAGVAERLRLLQKVARAVHYAHQRLVIHRDLKPANVLVRADGEPVLLDFGIAKLLDRSQRDAAQTAAPWFTPAYASPEQLRGETVSTASDVYSLGLLLYELLTDETPPSPRPQALRLGTHATGNTRVDRDLARIVAKATHADAERRYAGAEALALDLERYLAGRPVEAAPDRFLYRCRKFVQRHPLSVAISTLALALALFSVGALVVQRNRALAAEQSATAVRDFLLQLFRGADPDATGGATPDLLAILAGGAENAQSNTALAAPARAELLGALGTIYLNLGRFDDAGKLLDASSALWQASAPNSPARYPTRIAHMDLLTSTGKTRDAVQEGEALLGEIRADTRTTPDLLEQVLDKLGEARTVAGLTEAPAEAEAREHVALARTHAGDPLRLGLALDNLAMIQAARDETVDAEASAAEAVRLLEQAGPRGRFGLRAALLTHAGTLARLNRHDAAIALMAQSVALTRSLYAPGHPFIARSLNTYGNELAVSGRLDDAQAALAESLAIQRAKFGDDNPRMASTLFNLAALEENQTQFADAAAHLDKALALQVREHGAGDEHALQIAANLAAVEQELGRSDAAAARFDALEQRLGQNGVTSRSSARAALRLAHFRRQQGRGDAAARWTEAALALLETKSVDPLLQQDAALLHVETLAAHGRADAAGAAWAHALQLLDEIAADARYPAYENYLSAVRIALDRGDSAAAARLFTAADQALGGKAPMPRLQPLRATLAPRVTAAAPPR